MSGKVAKEGPQHLGDACLNYEGAYWDSVSLITHKILQV